jgi:hypothetical protein
MTHPHPLSVGPIVKSIVAGLLYVLGTMVFAMLAATIHFHVPDLVPPGTNMAAAGRMFAFSSALMGIALLPLTLYTQASRLARGLALFFLLFICLGVNATIELTIFSTFFVHGGALHVVISMILPALFCGFALSYLLPSPAAHAGNSAFRSSLATHSAPAWTARVLLAILAFPVIYFVFGSMVAPFVIPFYLSGASPLTIPPLSTILPVQFLRSSLFLLASTPFLFFWARSRASLIFALGLAHWFLVGLFGLVQVTWMPPVLRIAHSLEIAADSFVYAAVLVLLLAPRYHESAVSTPAHVAPMFPS